MAKGVETSELCLLSALELRRLIAAREVSPREVAVAFLARIRATDNQIRSFVTIDEEMAVAMADGAERGLKDGAHLALAGVPYALKDLTDTAGLRTTLWALRLERSTMCRPDAADRQASAGSRRGAAW